jgi:hypothetical protein
LNCDGFNNSTEDSRGALDARIRQALLAVPLLPAMR